MTRRLPAALVAAVLLGGLLSGLLTGCGSDSQAPGDAKVEVDTPQLRQIKQAAGIEDCQPGTADGGLPEVTLPCLGGGPDVDLATLKGPMIVNLWQSYCAPCRKEMPALQEFYEKHGDAVPVLGIDTADMQPQAALEFAKKVGVTYPLLADPGGDLSGQKPFPRIQGYPYLAIIDADGDLAYQQLGGVGSYDELLDLVDAHLGTDL
ncbi:TlpA disulfide reductase family protein [Nocardioides conyzicola]|uniref:Thioredoxin domain-containing protein n=1 Tax=Nocardioides conyzicola TaxID=1651781 RepID=A0ABP8X7C7_9ACTN